MQLLPKMSIRNIPFKTSRLHNVHLSCIVFFFSRSQNLSFIFALLVTPQMYFPIHFPTPQKYYAQFSSSSTRNQMHPETRRMLSWSNILKSYHFVSLRTGRVKNLIGGKFNRQAKHFGELICNSSKSRVFVENLIVYYFGLNVIFLHSVLMKLLSTKVQCGNYRLSVQFISSKTVFINVLNLPTKKKSLRK